MHLLPIVYVVETEQVSPVTASVKSRFGAPWVKTLTLFTVPPAVKVTVTGKEAGAVPTFELGLTVAVPVPMLLWKVAPSLPSE
jgi:hypothetical protein